LIQRGVAIIVSARRAVLRANDTVEGQIALTVVAQGVAIREAVGHRFAWRAEAVTTKAAADATGVAEPARRRATRWRATTEVADIAGAAEVADVAKATEARARAVAVASRRFEVPCYADPTVEGHVIAPAPCADGEQSRR